MATLVFGPQDRWPDVARGEWQWARINGAQTAVLVQHGGGMVHTVVNGAAGTLIKLYDTPEGGTTDDTMEIATLGLEATRETATLDVSFSKGLTAIVTGAGDCTVSFIGRQTVSSRTFGTQLDGNAGRAQGTSTDKALPD